MSIIMLYLGNIFKFKKKLKYLNILLMFITLYIFIYNIEIENKI
jgi:uncharacterized membrane protein